MPAGVLWVASNNVDPNLSAKELCNWYENTHIQEVLALPGVVGAARYEAISPSPFPGAFQEQYKWLTVYEMPDIAFRETKEFKGLDGQSEPKKELLERIFKRTAFNTRFWEEIQLHEAPGAAKGPANLIISAALTPAPEIEEDFDAWYREEHLRLLGECPGYRRTRRFKLKEASVLERFVRKDFPSAKYLALHEFDGEVLPMEQLARADETEWSKRVIAKLTVMEPGFYRLKRTYGDQGTAESRL